MCPEFWDAISVPPVADNIRECLGFVAAMAVMAASAALNYYLTQKTNQQNRDWQLEDQEHQDEREDNALSRRISDAQNAGLSPLAALNTGAAQATTVNRATAQIPSLDSAPLMSYLTDSDMTDKKTESDEKIERMRGDNAYAIAKLQSDTQKGISQDNIKSNESIASANRQSSESIASANRQSNESIESDKLAESARQADNSLLQKDSEMNLDYIKSVNNSNALYAQLQASAESFNAEQLSKVVDSNIDAEKQWCNDMGVTFKVESVSIRTPEDWKKYQSMLSAYESRKNSIMSTYQSYRDANKDNPEALASLYSKNKSKSGGLSAGLQLPETMQSLGNVGKLGANGSLQGQFSDGETVSKSEYNERLSMRALIGNQTLTYPVPRVTYQSPKPVISDWRANTNYKRR